MEPILNSEQLAFFKQHGFIEVDLCSVIANITKDRCESLAQRLCRHINQQVSERGGPADGIDPSKPVAKSFYNMTARRADPQWTDPFALFKKLPDSKPNTRKPLIASSNGMGLAPTVYDLEDQVALQEELIPVFQELYKALNCPHSLNEDEASNLTMNLERFGVKYDPKKDMPCHVDMAFCREKASKPLRDILDISNPQSFQAGQRIQCVVHLNTTDSGWYGYGFKDGMPSDSALGDLFQWPGATKRIFQTDESLVRSIGLQRTETSATVGHAIFWSCAVPHGNLPVKKGGAPRIVMYANCVPRPLPPGEAPLIMKATSVVGLGNHAKNKTVVSSSSDEAEEDGSPVLKRSKYDAEEESGSESD
jgi:hypothetical protein